MHGSTMSRALKTSGYLGLAVMMTVGLYQTSLLASAGQVPGWMVGGHAHLGVLSILAVVTGFAIPAFDLTGTLETVTVGLFLLGQWLLPLTIWAGEGGGLLFLMPTIFLWGLFLIIAMLILAWAAWSTDHAAEQVPPATATADD